MVVGLPLLAQDHVWYLEEEGKHVEEKENEEGKVQRRKEEEKEKEKNHVEREEQNQENNFIRIIYIYIYMSTPDYKTKMRDAMCPNERNIMGKYWQRTKTCEILKEDLTCREKYVKYIILLLKMHQEDNKSIFEGNIHKNLKARDVLDQEFPFLKWGRRFEFGKPAGGPRSGPHKQDMLSSGKKIYPKFFTFDNGQELFNKNSFDVPDGKDAYGRPTYKNIPGKNLYEYLAEQMVAFKEKNPSITESEYCKDISGYVPDKKKGGRKRRTRRRRRKRTKKKRKRTKKKRKRRKRRRKSRK